MNPENLHSNEVRLCRSKEASSSPEWLEPRCAQEHTPVETVVLTVVTKDVCDTCCRVMHVVVVVELSRSSRRSSRY